MAAKRISLGTELRINEKIFNDMDHCDYAAQDNDLGGGGYVHRFDRNEEGYATNQYSPLKSKMAANMATVTDVIIILAWCIYATINRLVSNHVF